MTKRMVFILFMQVHLAAGMSIYSVRIIESTSKGHWEPILLGCLLEFFLVWMYMKGMAVSKGRQMVDVLASALGKWGALLLLLPVIIYLACRLISLVRYQIIEINIILLPKTPLWATTLIYVAMPLYAASKGMSAIIRLSVAVCFLFVPFVFFSLIISFRNFDYFNAFPIWDSTAAFVTKPSFYVSMYANSGFLFLGMLTLDKPITMRSLWPILILVTFFYLAVVYVPLFVFGQECLSILEHPPVIASDTIDVEWVVFDWLPTFYIVASSAVSFLEATVTVWMIMLIVRKLIVPFPPKWILVFIGIVAFCFNLMIRNVTSLNRLDTVNVVFCLYSIVIVPLVIFLTSLRRRGRPA
ncbi:GerAB/ArcD/ProY family transporter [Cohnella herbarum]|uniref:GerAB/ArcD/ProY family transporter n=1 Tax=Cohnella herbarum TaxID=2728023 RepID=A0A7Z2VF47_9BACL|nr:GerAB/ArcD/ProY family transporter [Cohnella herbarum]QJD82063.1 GerAB/ArcD/ProY family transporter [Cohnella herbarum]